MFNHNINDDIREENYEQLAKFADALGKILTLIHSDIFQKIPRGQVKVGNDIQIKRYLKLLNAADEGRVTMDDYWSGMWPGTWEKFYKEGKCLR